MEGWIKLYRSFLCWEWYKNINTKVVFIHLLLKVNFENKRWQGIDIPRGTYITSVNHLADELGLTPRKIRTALNNLKSTHEITIKTTNKHTRITIENYNNFQGMIDENDKQNDKQEENQTTTKRQQLKNVKNIYLYFINKYKGQNLKSLREKMKFLKDIQNDEKYKELTSEEVNELRMIILGGTNE